MTKAQTKTKTYHKDNQALDYLEITNGDNLPTVVLLHGYGANMRDLAPLASMLAELKQYNWIFPDGPLKVEIGPHMYGKSWFPIDMQQMNQKMMTGGFEHLFSDHYPEGMEASSMLLKSFLIDCISGKLILGGFSQGSMMACDLVFNMGVKVDALILLSSTLVARDRLEKSLLNEKQQKIPIFQSHGTGDPVLPLPMARKLKELFTENSYQVDYHEFPGGHEIPPPILQSLFQFLQRTTMA